MPKTAGLEAGVPGPKARCYPNNKPSYCGLTLRTVTTRTGLALISAMSARKLSASAGSIFQFSGRRDRMEDRNMWGARLRVNREAERLGKAASFHEEYFPINGFT
jgi:hypothetical protein